MVNSLTITKCIREVMQGNNKFSYEDLDAQECPVKQLLYLANIYKGVQASEMTALDYRNVYDILYMLCLPNFGNSLQPKRVKLANDYIEQIKCGKLNLSNVISSLMTNNNYN